MSQTKYKETIKHNKEVIESLDDPDVARKYPCLADYLKSTSPLHRTLMKVLDYIETLNPDKRESNSRMFWLTAKKTSEARERKRGEGVSNHHMNMLCAMGIFRKRRQSKSDTDTLLPMEKDFLEKNKGKRKNRRLPGTYYFLKYNESNLRNIERNCERLKEGGITAGNISYVRLCCNYLDDIARKVYFENNPEAPQRNDRIYADLDKIMDRLIDEKGYCTRPEIKGMYHLENEIYKKEEVKKCDKELDYVISVHKIQINWVYWYKRPTEQEKKDFGLKGEQKIYIRRKPKYEPLENDISPQELFSEYPFDD